MARSFIVTAREGRIIFGSGYHRASFIDYLRANEDSEFRIAKAKPDLSEKMRGYYWAVVVPTAKRSVKEWGELSNIQVHECLKKMFNWFEAWNPETGRLERFAGSIMSDETSTQEGVDFIDKVSDWLILKYKTQFPSSDDYKRKRDDPELINP